MGMSNEIKDVLIIGAGAYGLKTAVWALRYGLTVGILEKNEQAGKKILISGGGRCNYTNLHTNPDAFISDNPRFVKQLLSAWSVQDTLDFFAEYGIHPKEKTLGQLFPEQGNAKTFRDGMLSEILARKGEIEYQIRIREIIKEGEIFIVTTHAGETYKGHKLVIATGGKAIPAMGASDWGMLQAKSWGMEIIPDAPALVPLVAVGENLLYNQALAGLSTSVALSVGKIRFVENILFTHKGWSGPAVLQISSYWNSGQFIQIDYLPEEKNMESLWVKDQVPFNILKGWIPSRLLETWVQTQPWLIKKSQEISNKEKQLTEKYLKQGQLLPSGTLGYEKAEVMKGGVDTRELIPQTLESRKMPGTYWGGEVCDVTGWLGGYNFQWAWVSAFVTARAIYSSLKG